MIYYYSPYTKELIKTDTPAEWMSETEIEPNLEYDESTSSLFFSEDDFVWYIVESEPQVTLKTVFSVREFRSRFTNEEQILIREASLTDMEVGLVYDEFQSAQYIDIDDPQVELGLTLYVSKSLIDENRKAELLSPEENVE